MTIHDFTEKIKLILANVKDRMYSQEKGLKIKEDLYIVIIIILVGTASFGLGKISGYEKEKTPISILKTRDAMYSTVLAANQTAQTSPTKPASDLPAQAGEVVASKSGTKYYYPWCSGVSRIKEENKVWFDSIEKARSVGLTPASNCTGLK